MVAGGPIKRPDGSLRGAKGLRMGSDKGPETSEGEGVGPLGTPPRETHSITSEIERENASGERENKNGGALGRPTQSEGSLEPSSVHGSEEAAPGGGEE